MLGLSCPSPNVNLNHPLNVGRVFWSLSHPSSNPLVDLITGVSAKLQAGETVKGPPRQGGFGRAYFTTSAGEVAQFSNHPLQNNIPFNGKGMTIACWVYVLVVPTSSNDIVLMEKYSVGLSAGFRLVVDSSAKNITVLFGTLAQTSTGVIATGAWVRVLVTIGSRGPTNSTTRFYFNGRQDSTFNKNFSTAAKENGVGVQVPGTHTSSVSSGSAYIDDATFWNRALNQSEAWLDYVESQCGYPNAMLHTPRYSSVQGAPIAFQPAWSLQGVVVGTGVC